MEKDKKESMERLTNFRQKFNFRQLFMISVLIFATAADILVDYVSSGFDPAIFKETSYWIMLSINCLSVVFVTLTVRDFFREKELRENSSIVDTQRQIDGAHNELMKRNLTTCFEEYVYNVNHDRKLKAYTAWLQFELSKVKKEKKRKRLQSLLDSAERDIEFIPTQGDYIKPFAIVRIHFSRVRIATIFSRLERTVGDDDDLETHEQRHVGGLIFKKIAMLMAFSMAFSTLFFQPGEFSVAILVSTFTKLFRTTMSIVLGATDGQDFARGTILSKMNLRLDFIQKFLENERAKRSVEAFMPEEVAE